jgi:hypothetical protein
MTEPTRHYHKTPTTDSREFRMPLRGSVAMLGMKKIRTSVLVLLVLPLACGAQSKHSFSGPPLAEEQLDVYRSFLDKFSALHVKNLSKITLPLDFNGFPEGRPCLAGIALENSSDAPKLAHVFGPEITDGRQLKLVEPLEQTKLLKQRDAASANQSKQAAQNGNGLNFLIFSEIAFDTKHTFAVLKYLLVCGEHCDSGATLVMEKVDGHWTTNSRRPCAQFVN